MSKSFEVKLNPDSAGFFTRIKNAAHGNGIQFSGDEAAGHFVGHGIEGNYRVDGEILTVQIVKKPFIVPWGLIEEKLRHFFS